MIFSRPNFDPPWCRRMTPQVPSAVTVAEDGSGSGSGRLSDRRDGAGAWAEVFSATKTIKLPKQSRLMINIDMYIHIHTYKYINIYIYIMVITCYNQYIWGIIIIIATSLKKIIESRVAYVFSQSFFSGHMEIFSATQAARSIKTVAGTRPGKHTKSY